MCFPEVNIDFGMDWFCVDVHMPQSYNTKTLLVLDVNQFSKGSM